MPNFSIKIKGRQIGTVGDTIMTGLLCKTWLFLKNNKNNKISAGPFSR